MAPTRPVLRWHGGKWKLAPWIIEHFPIHRIYVEPFGGAASVLMRKPRSFAEVYGDLDGEVVNLFRMVRDRGIELAEALALTPYAEDEFLDAQGLHPDPLERARRLCVRSWMGLGASGATQRVGFRHDIKRRGTSPATDWHRFPVALAQLVERLRGVVIENRDAAEVMLYHDSPETLHYVDPPYLSASRDRGRDYRHEMTDQDHQALAVVLNSLQGMVVLSGYDQPAYDEHYKGWAKVYRKSFADGGRARTEALWLSPNIPARGFFCAGLEDGVAMTNPVQSSV